MKRFFYRNNKKRILLAGALYFIAATTFVFGAASEGSTRRFGIFIGSNNGGKDRAVLHYAVSDARSISKVFSQMGGIAPDDMVLLVEPSVKDITNRISVMQEQVIRSKAINKRTEIVFYYSGHSDEEGLLLNREKYSYRELRNRINAIPSDMRIVILDSCASGAFTRIKGGNKTQPFLMDSSVSTEGYAFLTSSSADEVSQESDRIAASYFTHSLVAGLRGAADSVGDGRVTLNELYRFTYAETLARTETSAYGAQHPSYDIQVNGTGDLVLTDIKETSAGIVFDSKLTGRLSVRDKSDYLVAEITKTARPLELGLEPGLYRITLQQGSDLLRAELTISAGQRTLVTQKDFTFISASPARRRGNEEPPEEEDSENTPSSEGNLYTFFVNNVSETFRFPLIGFINIARGNHSKAQVGFFNSNTGNFNGIQVSFINITGGSFNGVQAGFINNTAGDTKGLQWGFVNTAGNVKGAQAGFVNTAKSVNGVQAGFVNTTAGKVKGLQFGFVNYADSIEDGVPIGFISIVRKGGYRAIEYSFSEFYPVTLGFKTGVEKFYTSLFVSYYPSKEHNRENMGEYLAAGIGIGSILPITGSFFFNPELNQFSPMTWFQSHEHPSTSYTTLVTSFGYKFGNHFSVSAGPSVTWIQNRDPSLPRPLFELGYDINDTNRIVVGARAAVQVRF